MNSIFRLRLPKYNILISIYSRSHQKRRTQLTFFQIEQVLFASSERVKIHLPVIPTLDCLQLNDLPVDSLVEACVRIGRIDVCKLLSFSFRAQYTKIEIKQIRFLKDTSTLMVSYDINHSKRFELSV